MSRSHAGKARMPVDHRTHGPPVLEREVDNMATKRSSSFLDSPISLERLVLDNYVTLKDKLQVNKVIPHLIQEEILLIEDKEDIMAHTTSQEKAQALVDKVITRGNCTPSLFVDILRWSGHGPLADVLEGEPNKKVARTEGFKDMTESQLAELKSRLQKVYREEVERHERNTSLDGLMGYEIGDAEPRIQLPEPEGLGFRLVHLEQLWRGTEPFVIVDNLTIKSLEKADHQSPVGPTTAHANALVADWVGDQKVTSRFEQLYQLRLDKVQKDDTIIDAISDQLLRDSKYNHKRFFSKDSLWRHMEQTQEKILFVLEGLDRLNPFTSMEILQLIDKKLLPRATVIVTVAEANGA